MNNTYEWQRHLEYYDKSTHIKWFSPTSLFITLDDLFNCSPADLSSPPVHDRLQFVRLLSTLILALFAVSTLCSNNENYKGMFSFIMHQLLSVCSLSVAAWHELFIHFFDWMGVWLSGKDKCVALKNLQMELWFFPSNVFCS